MIMVSFPFGRDIFLRCGTVLYIADSIFQKLMTFNRPNGNGMSSARAGLFLSTRDHGAVGYRVPREWATLMEEQRGAGSLAGFKRGSRAGFLAEYGAFVCAVHGCYVCRGGAQGGPEEV